MCPSTQEVYITQHKMNAKDKKHIIIIDINKFNNAKPS